MLLGLVSLSEEELNQGMSVSEKVDELLKTSKLINSYAHFKNMIELGVQVKLNDIPFEKAMMFSWIKEELSNGRKN